MCGVPLANMYKHNYRLLQGYFQIECGRSHTNVISLLPDVAINTSFVKNCLLS